MLRGVNAARRVKVLEQEDLEGGARDFDPESVR